MAITVVSFARVAVVDSDEVGRSAVHSSGPRTLPWGMPAFTRKSSVYSFSTLTRKSRNPVLIRKYLLCR
jgi:hypothetical protein